MSRRAIPWTFFAGALLSVVLLLADTVRASKPGGVPDLRGHWDGFFLPAGGAVAPGLVRSDITRQLGRRVAGDGRLFDAATGARLVAYNFGGTLGADNVLTAAGQTPGGRVVLRAGLQLFAGDQGDAGVLDGQLLLVPGRGQPGLVGTLLLRPFPDADAPDVSGTGLGVFRSRLDPTFVGGLALQIQSRERNSFPGFVSFTPLTSLHAPFTWQSRATINDRGRIVVIAQGKTGRMVVDGAVFPGRNGAGSIAVDGLYTLIMNSGLHDFGTYNFNLAPRAQ
jgi:hypothetical protein